MPVSDASDVNRVTGSLSSVFQNPLEISPESQESAANMIESFINVIDQLDSVDDAVNSLSNILDVSSKLLQSSSAMANVNDPNNTDVKAIKSMESNDTKVKVIIILCFCAFPTILLRFVFICFYFYLFCVFTSSCFSIGFFPQIDK